MSGFREELGKFILDMGPLVVSKPVGGSQGKVLACQILVRANAAKLAGKPVGLSSSTAAGGSAPDVMMMSACFVLF